MLAWAPGSSCNFINLGSATECELRHEAAIVLQRFSRGVVLATGSVSVDSCTDPEEESATDSSGEQDEGENSLEAVAVRRAFMTSIASNNFAIAHDDSWNYERILTWISRTLDIAMEADDPATGARVVWWEIYPRSCDEIW